MVTREGSTQLYIESHANLILQADLSWKLLGS
jgi:hypothetical protein